MNGMNTFSLSSFINASWKIFKRHWKFLVLLWLATGIVQLFLQFIEQSSEHGHIEIVLRIVAMIFVAIISIMISLGWANTTLSLVRQDKGQWSQFETEPGAWLRLIKVSLWFVLYMVVWSVIAAAVFAILGIIGLFVHVHVLAIIGGILAYIAVIVTMVYFALRYQFITYAVLDYPNLTSHQIFKKAGQITKGHLLDLLGLLIVLGLINIAGLICIVIGLAVTIPLTKLAKAQAYESLKNNLAHTTPHHEPIA